MSDFSDTDDEWFLWAEYKHCDLPGPAAVITDLLMKEGGK